MTLFRLYAKTTGSSRFRPMDWNASTLVVNLIHATLFTPEEKAKVSAILEREKDDAWCAGISWSWREVTA